ncbi:HIV Tat-specific factor 1 like [Schistosoma japonicum]|nr:HIV Tat-specific factor 1 like [Schistosoma japonicum]
MSSDSLHDFEEQIRLQNSQNVNVEVKTRIDPDGTVMEWIEQRKAWFPKIDDDFIAQYQMSYGVNTSNPHETSVTSEGVCNTVDWTRFNTELAQLRAAKGDDCEEVQQLMKAANESLMAYYSSPAYREWYENYCKQNGIQSTQPMEHKIEQKKLSSNKAKYELKPSERMLSGFLEGDDPDVALARAEAELLSGIQPTNANDVSTDVGIGEPQADNTQATDDTTNDPNLRKRKQTTPLPAWYEIDESKNTHVYVSGLPPTITDDEFSALMSKCGVIMNEPFTNIPRLKLYKDQAGIPKGDGRCCYVKVESVELALKILDGMLYTPGYTIHVERAKFQPKGEFDPKKRRRLTVKEKKKLKEQQENLFRWSIDTSKYVRGKKERVVILKNAFIESDFQRDVTLIPIVRERLRAQCAKCGVIKKIVVHDAHPEGVVSVTFSTPEEADTGIRFLSKALFVDYPGTGGARQLEAERWDGKTDYSVGESKDKEASRLQNWDEYLGGGDSSSSDNEETQAGSTDNNTDECTEPNVANAAARKSELAFDVPSDYWERLSEESQSSGVDTDDENNGGSGADTP